MTPSTVFLCLALLMLLVAITEQGEKDLLNKNIDFLRAFSCTEGIKNRN